MGIKFLCPNGHRLNVKAFLAGKKAVCPKCGEKVLVPTESDPIASRSKRGAVPSAPASPEPLPAVAVAEIPVAAVSPEVVVPQVPFVPGPVTAPAAAPGPAAADLIAEAPAAVWYVRPPSGGQYGPAPADVMRGWLAEGRVSVDSLVWRSDWPDWRSALVAFPQLGGAQVPAVSPQAMVSSAGASMAPAPYVAPVQPVQAMPAQAMPMQYAPVVMPQSPMVVPYAAAGIPMGQAMEYPAYAESATSHYDDAIARTKRRRQKGADATMIVSGILVALVVILFVVLALVLSQGTDEMIAPPRHKHKPPAAENGVPPKREPRQEEPKALDDEAGDRPLPSIV